jgi:hypothetical protein
MALTPRPPARRSRRRARAGRQGGPAPTTP